MKSFSRKISVILGAFLFLVVFLSIGFFLPPTIDLPVLPSNDNIEAKIRHRIADILHKGGHNTIQLNQDELNILVNQNLHRVEEHLPSFLNLHNIYVIPQSDTLTTVAHVSLLRGIPLYLTLDLSLYIAGHEMLVSPQSFFIGRNRMDRFFLSEDGEGILSPHREETFYTINTNDYQVNIKLLEVRIEDKKLTFDVRCTVR